MLTKRKPSSSTSNFVIDCVSLINYYVNGSLSNFQISLLHFFKIFREINFCPNSSCIHVVNWFHKIVKINCIESSYVNYIGPPEAPTNCSVVNQTTDSLEVECLPAFDGGLKQYFGLEVTDLQSGILLVNATDTVPDFQVS